MSESSNILLPQWSKLSTQMGFMYVGYLSDALVCAQGFAPFPLCLRRFAIVIRNVKTDAGLKLTFKIKIIFNLYNLYWELLPLI